MAAGLMAGLTRAEARHPDMMHANQHQVFAFRSPEEIRQAADAMGLEIPFSHRLDLAAEPLRLAGRTISNRFAIQPMEGFDADTDGTPGPLAFRRYQRYAAGGAGLIWFEATAILPEGRSNPCQFWLHADNVAEFARLVTETRATASRTFGREPLLILQLTHSGRYSKPALEPRPLIAHHSPILDPLTRVAPDAVTVTDDYLDTLPDHFAAAARLAAQAGFDGVDVKACHRYLLSELLASFTRPGRYGGDFDNRTRLLRESLAAIRVAAPDLIPTTRLNIYDALPHPYGWGMDSAGTLAPDLREPLLLIGLLRNQGVPLLNVTLGNPYYQAFYGRPFDTPLAGAAVPPEHPLAGVARFIRLTRTVQEAYPELPVIGSGYTWLRHGLPEVAAGVLERRWAAMIGLGRQAFAYPDAVKDILATGAMRADQCCITCSACTQIMRDGGHTGCVIRDAAIYGPEYRKSSAKGLRT